MSAVTAPDLRTLYDHDETAWLDAMAALAAGRHVAHMDFPHLSEYLTDMAKRDRREVFSRLVVLLAHLLKWEYQPENRGGSWRVTIREQRRELRALFASGALRNHAEAVFAEAYAEARGQAADETELDPATFPADNPWTLDAALDVAV